jgi:hypothetical protein
LKEPPLKPNLAPAQKLISHLLVRDVITGALSLQMVAIGERGLFLFVFLLFYLFFYYNNFFLFIRTSKRLKILGCPLKKGAFHSSTDRYIHKN